MEIIPDPFGHQVERQCRVNLYHKGVAPADKERFKGYPIGCRFASRDANAGKPGCGAAAEVAAAAKVSA